MATEVFIIANAAGRKAAQTDTALAALKIAACLNGIPMTLKEIQEQTGASPEEALECKTEAAKAKRLHYPCFGFDTPEA